MLTIGDEISTTSATWIGGAIATLIITIGSIATMILTNRRAAQSSREDVGERTLEKLWARVETLEATNANLNATNAQQNTTISNQNLRLSQLGQDLEESKIDRNNLREEKNALTIEVGKLRSENAQQAREMDTMRAHIRNLESRAGIEKGSKI